MRHDFHLHARRSPDDPGGGEGTPEPEGGQGQGGDGTGSKPGTVTMSQAALNRLIDDKFTKAYEKARGEQQETEAQRLRALGVESWEELRERIAGGGAGGGGGGKGDGDDAIRKAVAEATDKLRKQHQQELQALTGDRDTALDLANTLGVRNSVRAAAAALGAYDPDEVVTLMHGRFRLNTRDKTVEVLTEGGNPAVGADGGPVTVEAAVAEWAATKPHMFKAEARGGTGKGPTGAAARTSYRRAELANLSREDKAKVLKGIEAGEITVVDA